MDLLAAGKMMGFETGSSAGVRYQVKMKLINESISVQNRMILCKAVARDDDAGNERIDARKELAHEKLTRAYRRAHKLPDKDDGPKPATSNPPRTNDWCIPSLLTGFCLGTAVSFLMVSRLIRK